MESETAQTVFTLSFGGVDFRLTPDAASLDSNVPLISVEPTVGKNKDLVLNLSSFSGNLRVSLATDENRGTATVEEEPASPVPTNSLGVGGQLSPGQQKLNFSNTARHKTAMGTTAGSKSSKRATGALSTPNVIPHSSGLPPSRPKKDGAKSQQKRNVPEIETDPHASPTPRKKNRREEAIVESENTEMLLGQLSQLSQTGTSECSTDNDTDGDANGIVESRVLQEHPSFLSSSINSSHLQSDDQSTSSSRILEKDSVSLQEENAVIEANDERVNGGVALTSIREGPESNTSTEKGPPPPSPRWGHTMTAIDKNRILVYGGQSIDVQAAKTKTLSDLHVYDVSKGLWYKPINCEGVPRQWHSATFLPDRQLLISFGGESANPKTGKITTTDQVMVLDTEIMLWYPPSVSGAVPSGRSGHTATLLPNSNELVVFGGVKGTKWQNSVAVLDIARWKWSSPKILGDSPRPRSYHSATAVSGNGQSNRLVIFGGNDRASSFNTVHVLETDGKKWLWSHPKTSGTAPSPRTGHCATLLDDKKSILVYGGWDPNADDDGSDEEIIFGDSFVLDTVAWTWTAGPKPVFSRDESQVQDGGELRVGHKSVLTNGKDGAQVLVFGGRIPNDQFASDFQTLTVPENLMG